MTKAEQKKAAAKRTPSHIPTFNTVEEEAAFWDTHSTTEFEDEFEEAPDVQFVVSRAKGKRGITVRLEEDSLEAIRREAREKGIGPSTLIRMWVLERLRAERGKTA